MAFKKKTATKPEPEIQESSSSPAEETKAPIEEAKKAAEEETPRMSEALPAVEEKKPMTVAEKKTAINTEFVSADKAEIQCRIMEDVNAVIGKRRWTLSKGSIVKVPGSVYEVLKAAKKAL